jgi:GH18 family chitinase
MLAKCKLKGIPLMERITDVISGGGRWMEDKDNNSIGKAQRACRFRPLASMLVGGGLMLATAPIAVANPICASDIDGSGRVELGDFSKLLVAFGSDDPEADINQDGIVDIDDFSQMLVSWGPCSKVVGYYIEWGVYGRDYQPMDIPGDKLTHINYAFADIGDDLTIKVGDSYAALEKLYPGDTWDQPLAGTYNQINNVLKAEHPHLKTFISVGGWTWSGKFSDVALTESSRSNFAASCVDFIRAYGFDGVDIDWEYPVCCGLSNNTYRPEDADNYVLLLEELRAQLDVAAAQDGTQYLLTIASPAGYDKLAYLDLAAIVAPLDWVNVMTYDLHGAWDLSNTNHHSALYPNPNDDDANELIRERYNVDWALQEFLANGVPAEKIVMGVPMYGRAWGGVQPEGGNGGGNGGDNGGGTGTLTASIEPAGLWETSFNANLVLRNDSSSPVNGWAISFGYEPVITSLWNGDMTVKDNLYIVTDLGWNASIAPGAEISIGFQANGAFTDQFTSCELNGGACDGSADTEESEGNNEQEGNDEEPSVLFAAASSVPAGTWDDGTSGATGVTDFTEIEDFISSGQYTRYWDDYAKVPYLYSPSAFGGHFISYDDLESIGIKIDYVNSYGLGGMMYWEVTADRNQTLIDAIADGLSR